MMFTVPATASLPHRADDAPPTTSMLSIWLTSIMLGLIPSLVADMRDLRDTWEATSFELDEAIKDLRIKVSGCFNSCGQHHVADIGFYGVSRKAGGHTVPHFQVVLGGQWSDNAGAYGLPMGAVPSKNIPAAHRVRVPISQFFRQADAL